MVCRHFDIPCFNYSWLEQQAFDHVRGVPFINVLPSFEMLGADMLESIAERFEKVDTEATGPVFGATAASPSFC